MNVPGHRGILRVIISGFKHNLAVFQHLQKLVHLNGMKFANLIQKQNASMRLGHSAGLGLRNALHTQRARPLINGIVYAADQGIRNSPFIKADAGGVHLNKRRV